jgi:hypothetical protein
VGECIFMPYLFSLLHTDFPSGQTERAKAGDTWLSNPPWQCPHHVSCVSFNWQGKINITGADWWFTPVILATQEAETGGSQFEAGPDKQSLRPYLKNTQYKG